MRPQKMILFAAFLIAGLLIAGCNTNVQLEGLTPIPSLAPGATETLVPALQGQAGGTAQAVTGAGPGDPAVGAPIYFKNCSQCHGNQAEGDIGPALRNNQFIQSSDVATIYNTVASGIPHDPVSMPAWLMANGGPLFPQDINNVVAFLKDIQNIAALPSATPLPTQPAPTPLPPNAPTPAPAAPSIAGGPGQAVSLTGDATRGKPLFGTYCSACHGPEGIIGGPNPRSDDEFVPALNPIDPTIANADPKVFANNVDLFVEHGSVPSGPAPEISMPSFGDLKILQPQQIADIIAYVLGLNGVK